MALSRSGKKKFVSWSVYPQLELNTSEASAAKDLVERHAQVFFPTEFTVQRGRFKESTAKSGGDLSETAKTDGPLV